MSNVNENNEKAACGYRMGSNLKRHDPGLPNLLALRLIPYALASAYLLTVVPRLFRAVAADPHVAPKAGQFTVFSTGMLTAWSDS